MSGWDIRGDGGYVVGPGSFYDPTADELAKGKLAGHYRISTDAPIAPAPVWLLDLLRAKGVRHYSGPLAGDRAVVLALGPLTCSAGSYIVQLLGQGSSPTS